MPSFIDLTGQKFNDLTVISRTDNQGQYVTWDCKCICGKVIKAQTRHLRGNEVKSCGCRSNHYRSCNNPNTRGVSKDPAFRCWKLMRYRCRKAGNDNWDNYGGRGIKVHPDFEKFETFIEHIGPRPSMRHTVDRIDVNKGYTYGNIRWATSQEQSNNTRKSIRWKCHGELLTITQLSYKYGGSIDLWRDELLKKGYHAETVVYKLRNGYYV